ncbi:MAG: YciI family protein [Myxococcota bacterium]
MQYAILIYERAEGFARRGDPERHAAYMAPYEAYVASLREEGVLVGGEVLRRPDTATSLSVVDGVRHIQDGPVAHSREQLGGFLIVEAPDLDAALDIAARCPAALEGKVEVRPCGMETPGS